MLRGDDGDDASTMRTLAAELAERGPLPLHQAVAYTLEACEAVAEAHALSLPHGSLGLENVFLAGRAHGTSVKVDWPADAYTRTATREDVAQDLRALGELLRSLVTGTHDSDIDGATTLPSSMAHIVTRALAGSFNNVAELARALAPYAPPDHASARKIALALSRAGIVGGGIPLAAPKAETIPLTDEWFGPRSQRAVPPGPFGESLTPKRELTFALVTLALVGFTLGGCLFLWRSERLPRWTGTAPPEVGTATITNAPAPPRPAVVTEGPNADAPRKRTAADLLRSAPVAPVTSASVAAPPALAPKVMPAASRETTTAAEPRRAPPPETPASADSTQAVSGGTVTPTLDPDPAPAAR